MKLASLIQATGDICVCVHWVPLALKDSVITLKGLLCAKLSLTPSGVIALY